MKAYVVHAVSFLLIRSAPESRHYAITFHAAVAVKCRPFQCRSNTHMAHVDRCTTTQSAVVRGGGLR